MNIILTIFMLLAIGVGVYFLIRYIRQRRKKCPTFTRIYLYVDFKFVNFTLMGYYRIVKADFMTSPDGIQTATISFRRFGELQWIVASNSVEVLANGTLAQPFDIDGLTPGVTYEVSIVNNCGGQPYITKVSVPPLPTEPVTTEPPTTAPVTTQPQTTPTPTTQPPTTPPPTTEVPTTIPVTTEQPTTQAPVTTPEPTIGSGNIELNWLMSSHGEVTLECATMIPAELYAQNGDAHKTGVLPAGFHDLKITVNPDEGAGWYYVQINRNSVDIYAQPFNSNAGVQVINRPNLGITPGDIILVQVHQG